MKKRNKRRLDYEKYLSLKGAGKKIDEKLQEMVEQYEALNETLKLELPKLSSLIYEVAHICLIQLIGIQSVWFGIWQEKVKAVLEDNQMPNDVSDIVNMFARDFKYVEVRAQELAIVNGSFLTATPKPRTSQSTPTPISITASTEPKGRPSNLSSRSRGMSINSDQTPSLPTPDFERSHRHSGQFAFSPIGPPTPSFQFAHHIRMGILGMVLVLQLHLIRMLLSHPGIILRVLQDQVLVGVILRKRVALNGRATITTLNSGANPALPLRHMAIMWMDLCSQLGRIRVCSTLQCLFQMDQRTARDHRELLRGIVQPLEVTISCTWLQVSSNLISARQNPKLGIPT
jgi:hypothetical protein